MLALTIILIFLMAPGNLAFQLHSLTRTAQWSARHQLQIQTVNFSTQPESLILYGGCNDAFYNTGLNDVWVSTNTGYSWDQILASPSNNTFGGSVINSYCRDPIENISYVISQHPYGNSVIKDVLWKSTNSLLWSGVIAQPISVFLDRYGSNCWVDSSSQLHYIFGINSTSANLGQYQGYSDIWTSQDFGSNWDQQSGNFGLQTRYNARMGTYLKSEGLNRDVIYIIGGQSGSGTIWETLIDDLWASSDGGLTWKQICDSTNLPWNNALFTNANGTFQVEAFYVHTNGLLIVSVNGDWINSQGVQNSRSDIWMSFDGGWTWSLCLQNTTYGSRQDPTLFINSTGYLYILGGFTYESDYIAYNDIWVSSVPFSDMDLIAGSCGTIVPSCGVGLHKWDGPCQPQSSDSTVRIVVPSVLAPIMICALLILARYLYQKYGHKLRRPTSGENADLINESELQRYKS